MISMSVLKTKNKFSTPHHLVVMMYLCGQIHKNENDYGGYINRAQYLRGTADELQQLRLTNEDNGG